MDMSAQLDTVIGVDPGARWTAAVLRHGDRPVHGWTLGPIDIDGEPAYDALDHVDDLHAMSRYVDRLTTALGQLEERSEKEIGVQPIVAIEAVIVPHGWRQRRTDRLALGDWLIPRSVVIGVMALYPRAVLVTPAGGKIDPSGRRPEPYGKRATSTYPSALRGTPPEGWGPIEARRRERDHERAAYDVAGVALDELRHLQGAA